MQISLKRQLAFLFLLLLIGCGVLLPALYTSQAFADLRVDNALERPLYFLYVSPAGQGDWQQDVLGDVVLMGGESVAVGGVVPAASLDIRGVDEDGHSYTIRSVHRRERTSVRITEQDADAAEQSYRGLGWITVENITEVPLLYLYASPAYADTWAAGEQLFTEGEVLMANDSRSLYIEPDNYRGTAFDFLAEDIQGNRYIHWDVNIQLRPRVVFRIQDIR